MTRGFDAATMSPIASESERQAAERKERELAERDAEVNAKREEQPKREEVGLLPSGWFGT